VRRRETDGSVNLNPQGVEMATVTFKGKPVAIAGDLPAVGTRAPDFLLVRGDLSEARLADFAGQTVVLSVFPSFDTPVCATAARRFNEAVGAKEKTVVLCVSVDLPFAQSRFCAAEGLSHVVPLSAFRSPEFGQAYGAVITGGPLRGLLSRAVLVIDPAGTIIHAEQVSEIAREPDYAAALRALA